MLFILCNELLLLLSLPFCGVETEEVELLKLLLVVILLFCCEIPGSTPLVVVPLLLIRALPLSEDGATDEDVKDESVFPFVLMPTAVESKGLEAVDISGVDEAEKSSPGCDV